MKQNNNQIIRGLPRRLALMALDCWYSRVSGVPQNAPVTQFFAEHFNDAYMQHRFQTMTIDPSKSGRMA